MVIISDASEEDLEQIYEIEVESFDKPYPISLLKAYLYLSNIYIVAKEDSKILGYAIGIIQFKKRGHVVSIATRKESRKKGIGTLLLSTLEKTFINNNCTYSYLEVMITNREAIRFYRNMNYLVIYTKKNYYGRGRHAYIMMKSLINKSLE
ncbi:ribosomal protein S18-alanine N-acetyltransferase [Acidianus brierleyi]|uniref:Ribosomal-protein-alanine N-acetyltransferase n=1 Tax=Acidianus brierleyi TaxID=41673 RepID=A0A2U9IFC0_9CREN|nr:ribosomal protein S18-alanine N-acetyltransferase [Acidianus brierleyi]AWR94686.1 ribosomal-protein-alanine N-acetyltransferase [Acidianus brierleyi]